MKGASILEGIFSIQKLLQQVEGKPDYQTFTALEMIAANTCWIPSLVDWLNEKYS